MLEQILQTAMRSAQITCVLGSTNKEESIRKTNGYVVTAGVRASCFTTYSKNNEHFKDGVLLEPHDYHLKDTSDSKVGVILEADLGFKWKLLAHPTQSFDPVSVIIKNEINPKINRYIHPLSASIISRHLRSGNCNDLASTIYCDLWEKATQNYNKYPIDRLEILYFSGFRHQILVVNRPKGSSRTDPNAWGKDAWIVDAWWEEGKIFRATELKEKYEELKKYVLQQEEFVNESSPGTYIPIPFNMGEAPISFHLLDSIRPFENPFPQDLHETLSFNEFSLPLHYIDFKDDCDEHKRKINLIHLNIEAVRRLKNSTILIDNANKFIELVKLKISKDRLKTAKNHLSQVSSLIRMSTEDLNICREFIEKFESNTFSINYAQAEISLLQTKFQYIVNQIECLHMVALKALDYIENQRNSISDLQASSVQERLSRRNMISRLEDKYQAALTALKTCFQYEVNLGFFKDSINTKRKMIEVYQLRGNLFFQEEKKQTEANFRFDYLIKSAQSFTEALLLEQDLDEPNLKKMTTFYLCGVASLSKIATHASRNILTKSQIECFKDSYCQIAEKTINSENMTHLHKKAFYYYIMIIHEFLIKHAATDQEKKKHINITMISAKNILGLSTSISLSIADEMKMRFYIKKCEWFNFVESLTNSHHDSLKKIAIQVLELGYIYSHPVDFKKIFNVSHTTLHIQLAYDMFKKASVYSDNKFLKNLAKDNADFIKKQFPTMIEENNENNISFEKDDALSHINRETPAEVLNNCFIKMRAFFRPECLIEAIPQIIERLKICPTAARHLGSSFEYDIGRIQNQTFEQNTNYLNLYTNQIDAQNSVLNQNGKRKESNQGEKNRKKAKLD